MTVKIIIETKNAQDSPQSAESCMQRMAQHLSGA